MHLYICAAVHRCYRNVILKCRCFTFFEACSNGYISFSNSFCHWNPNFGIGHDIIAAYWYDIDFRDGIGGFSATVHESTATDYISVKLFNQTKNYLEKYANVTAFSPVTVILGTWYKGTPYPYYNYVGKNEVILSEYDIFMRQSYGYSIKYNMTLWSTKLLNYHISSPPLLSCIFL